MIGLVAFDLVLRLRRRGVMPVAFVIEIFGVDGDDGPGHAARLRIPGDMVADFERLGHLRLLAVKRRSCARVMPLASLRVDSRDARRAGRFSFTRQDALCFLDEPSSKLKDDKEYACDTDR